MHQPIDTDAIARRKPRPSLHYEAIERPITDVALSPRQLRAIVLLLSVGMAALAVAVAVTWGRA